MSHPLIVEGREVPGLGRKGRPYLCRASYIGAGSVETASVQATKRKIQKFQGLPTSHLFQPVAIETLGPFNPSALEFISELGRRMSFVCLFVSNALTWSHSKALFLQTRKTRPDPPDKIMSCSL